MAINPGDLSFTPRTHLVEGKKTLTSPSASTVYHDTDGEKWCGEFPHLPRPGNLMGVTDAPQSLRGTSVITVS